MVSGWQEPQPSQSTGQKLLFIRGLQDADTRLAIEIKVLKNESPDTDKIIRSEKEAVELLKSKLEAGNSNFFKSLEVNKKDIVTWDQLKILKGVSSSFNGSHWRALTINGLYELRSFGKGGFLLSTVLYNPPQKSYYSPVGLVLNIPEDQICGNWLSDAGTTIPDEWSVGNWTRWFNIMMSNIGIELKNIQGQLSLDSKEESSMGGLTAPDAIKETISAAKTLTGGEEDVTKAQMANYYLNELREVVVGTQEEVTINDAIHAAATTTLKQYFRWVSGLGKDPKWFLWSGVGNPRGNSAFQALEAILQKAVEGIKLVYWVTQSQLQQGLDLLVKEESKTGKLKGTVALPVKAKSAVQQKGSWPEVEYTESKVNATIENIVGVYYDLHTDRSAGNNDWKRPVGTETSVLKEEKQQEHPGQKGSHNWRINRIRDAKKVRAAIVSAMHPLMDEESFGMKIPLLQLDHGELRYAETGQVVENRIPKKVKKGELFVKPEEPLYLSLSSDLSEGDPVFINGERVIFNKAVPTTPVALEPKSPRRRSANGSNYGSY